MSRPLLFDLAKRQQRLCRADRHFATDGALWQVVATNLADRLEVFLDKPETVLVLGDWQGRAKQALQGILPDSTITSWHALPHADIDQIEAAECPALPTAQYDLVISFMLLHTINDVPGHLAALANGVKPGGTLLTVCPGEMTAASLRQAMESAEEAVCGGLSPRWHPQLEMRSLAGLFNRVGLQMPVTDVDTLTVEFSSINQLLLDLRQHNLTNLLQQQTRPAPRKLYAAWAALFPCSMDVDLLFGHAVKPQ